MTHELHLGTHETDTVTPKALSLKTEYQEKLETNDEAVMILRRFNKFFSKNYKGKNTRKPTKLSYDKCGGLDHFVKGMSSMKKRESKRRIHGERKGTT